MPSTQTREPVALSGRLELNFVVVAVASVTPAVAQMGTHCSPALNRSSVPRKVHCKFNISKRPFDQSMAKTLTLTLSF